MKKQSTCSFKQMNTNHLEELTNTVNNHFTEGKNPFRNRKFTSAELWNIQRHGKERIFRKFYF